MTKQNTRLVPTAFPNVRTELEGYVSHIAGALDRADCVLLALESALRNGDMPSETTISTLDAIRHLLGDADVALLRKAIAEGFPEEPTNSSTVDAPKRRTRRKRVTSEGTSSAPSTVDAAGSEAAQ